MFKPFIKWVGWKRQLLSQFAHLYPENFNRYFEPFVWGGAVFFDLRNNYGLNKQSFLFDKNEELVITYNVIKNEVFELIEELKDYPYKKDFFLEIRSWDRKSDFKQKSNIQRAARFIYLNRTGFNGLYRVNWQGYYNVPFWKYTNPQICDRETLLNAQLALQNVEINISDFSEVLNLAKKGDFIYFDPPYDPLSMTSSFTTYQKDWFTRDDQIRLFNAYKQLSDKGCFVMLSNHNTPFINELYKDFRKEIVFAKRLVNANALKRGPIEETVILNY